MTQIHYQIHSIAKVIDGDTIDIILDLGFDIFTKKRIRLYGIDTPESRTRDEEEKKFGLLAKRKLQEWCEEPVIELRCNHSNVDKFGRVLGEIWVFKDNEWINVNKWLCDNHFAVLYNGENKDNVKDKHLENRIAIEVITLLTLTEIYKFYSYHNIYRVFIYRTII